jgi:hypothetical protein
VLVPALMAGCPLQRVRHGKAAIARERASIGFTFCWSVATHPSYPGVADDVVAGALYAPLTSGPPPRFVYFRR